MGLTTNLRKSIYRRDGFQCAICSGTKYLQIHHCIPRGRRGGDTPHNLITLCGYCHALAHGTNLDGTDFTQEDMQQAITEYLADLYAPDWKPGG